MKKLSLILALTLVLTNIFTVGGYAGFNPPAQPDPVSDYSFITPNLNTGKLEYSAYDDKGSTISDFSSAGFYGGKYELPETSSGSESIVATISVSPGSWSDTQITNGEADDAATINAAITEAASYITKPWHIAVVKLAPGKYYIPKVDLDSGWQGSIQLQSNVILSGSGQGPTGTVLYAYETYTSSDSEAEEDWGTAYRVIQIRGTGNPAGLSSTITNITDDYIEAGSNTFSVESTSSYAVGDLIQVSLPRSDAWSTALKMDNPQCVNSTTNTGWSSVTNYARLTRDKYPDDYEDTTLAGKNIGSSPTRLDVKMERTITAINGNEITVDLPFFVHVDQTVEDADYPYTIRKLSTENRVENAGVENLRILSEYDTSDSEPNGHAGYGVSIYRAKNCFVQNVTFKHMRHSAVYCHDYSKGITVRGCTSMDPKSTVAGGFRYTYGCGSNTQQILVNGCYSEEGRHDYQTSYTATGPIAFVDNVSEMSSTSSETHGTWSTGILFDNLIHIGDNTSEYKSYIFTDNEEPVLGFIAAANRGKNGTTVSQGWTGAGVVIWNSLTSKILAHDVAGDYQNFVFGIWGYYDKLSGTIAEQNVKTSLSNYKSIYHNDDGTPTDAFKTYTNSPIVGDATVQSADAPVEPRSLFKAQLAESVTGNFTKAKANAPTIVTPNPDYESSSTSVTVDGMYEKGATAVYVYIDNERNVATLDSSDYSFSLTTTLANGTHKIYATQVIDGVEGNKTPDRFVIVGEEGSNYDYLSSDYSASTLSLVQNDTRMTYNEYLDSIIIDDLPTTLGDITTSISGTADNTNVVTVVNQDGNEQQLRGKYVLLPARVSTLRGYTIPTSNYGFLISSDGEEYNQFDSMLELNNNSYGICFFNLAKDKYWFKQFVTYVDEDGNSHTVYGNPFEHTFGE